MESFRRRRRNAARARRERERSTSPKCAIKLHGPLGPLRFLQAHADGLYRGSTTALHRELTRVGSQGAPGSRAGYRELIFSGARGGSSKALLWMHQKNLPVATACTGAGVTALHFAAAGGHLHVVNFLLQLGADVRASTSVGTGALAFAAEGGNVALFRALLERGLTLADAGQPSRGLCVAHFAAGSGRVPMLEALEAAVARTGSGSGSGSGGGTRPRAAAERRRSCVCAPWTA